MKNALAGLLLIGLVGCANLETPMDDGYQVGDVGRTVFVGTERVLELQHAYCVNGDVMARGMLLMITRAAVPGYPADGLCTDLIGLFSRPSLNEG